jgi:hypothetical protein
MDDETRAAIDDVRAEIEALQYSIGWIDGSVADALDRLKQTDDRISGELRRAVNDFEYELGRLRDAVARAEQNSRSRY